MKRHRVLNNKGILSLRLFLKSGNNSRKRADLLRKWNIFHSYGEGDVPAIFDSK